MPDKLIDDEGYVYRQNLFGEWRQQQGVFGPVKDVNWLGQPRVERNILGQPKVARDFFGQPIQSGSGGDGGIVILVLFVILVPIGLLALAVWLSGIVLRAVWELLVALGAAWRLAVRSHPRTMLVVHLTLGTGAVYGGLTAAEFVLPLRVGGALLVPALWGWLWFTRRLPLILMPINAAIVGGALWWVATQTRATWQPTWSQLTHGLPAVGNLPAAVAVLPLLVWTWSRGMRHWPRHFVPLNLVAVGALLWFVLLRVWPDWQPGWARFVAPLPFIPPAGLLLLAGPLGLWLWTRGQARWPLPFVGANLLLLGGLLALSGYHTQSSWDAAWRYGAGGLPISGAPLLALTIGPVTGWSWLRASRWRPKWFLVPNLLLSGGIFWLLVDRTRPLWREGWTRAGVGLPLWPDPAMLALALPLTVWVWLHGRRRWPTEWFAVRALLLGLIAWLVAERGRSL